MNKNAPPLTQRQAAIIGAYTGIICGPFSDVHAYIEEILDRPVWTHQLADKAVWEEIKEKSRPDFMALVYDPDKKIPTS